MRKIIFFLMFSILILSSFGVARDTVYKSKVGKLVSSESGNRIIEYFGDQATETEYQNYQEDSKNIKEIVVNNKLREKRILDGQGRTVEYFKYLKGELEVHKKAMYCNKDSFEPCLIENLITGQVRYFDLNLDYNILKEEINQKFEAKRGYDYVNLVSMGYPAGNKNTQFSYTCDETYCGISGIIGSGLEYPEYSVRIEDSEEGYIENKVVKDLEGNEIVFSSNYDDSGFLKEDWAYTYLYYDSGDNVGMLKESVDKETNEKYAYSYDDGIMTVARTFSRDIGITAAVIRILGRAIGLDTDVIETTQIFYDWDGNERKYIVRNSDSGIVQIGLIYDTDSGEIVWGDCNPNDIKNADKNCDGNINSDELVSLVNVLESGAVTKEEFETAIEKWGNSFA